MRVTINGSAAEIAEGSTLQQLIISRKLAEKNLIVDVNGEIIKEKWEDIHINSGDNIELIQIVFGG